MRPPGQAKWHRPQKGRILIKGIGGAAEETRTPDPIITNDVLYQLSYSGPRPYYDPARGWSRQNRNFHKGLVRAACHSGEVDDFRFGIFHF